MIENASNPWDSRDVSPAAAAAYILDLGRELAQLAREARLLQLAAVLERANALAAEAAAQSRETNAASDDAA